MSDAMVLGGAEAAGFATVREVPAPGMIALKGDLGAPALAEAVAAVTGCAPPKRRGIAASGGRMAGWMAPDELLLVVPRAEVPVALDTLAARLADTHHLAADVSDMRAMFRVEGPAAREVLAKLCPANLAPGAFEPGELRRTRLAQVPAAFWLEDGGITLVCFRSVAVYAFDVLRGAAAEGGAVGHLS